jgi:type II secretory pathway component PulM
MKPLSPKGKVGLKLLIGLFLVMLATAILPFVALSLVTQKAEEAESELTFLRQKLNEKRTADLPPLPPNSDTSTMFLDGKTTGLSLAQLQGLVTRVATQHSIEIERVQPLQMEPQGAVQSFKLELLASSSIEHIRNFLLQLEQAEPFVFIREAKIGVTELNPAQAGVPVPLSLQLRLEAYGLAERSP